MNLTSAGTKASRAADPGGGVLRKSVPLQAQDGGRTLREPSRRTRLRAGQARPWLASRRGAKASGGRVTDVNKGADQARRGFAAPSAVT